MGHKGILSSTFNMSLGFIPVVITMLLCEFTTQAMAVYIGSGIGGAYSLYMLRRTGIQIPNFILYISTAILALLTLTELIPGEYVPPGALPLTLEVSILVPMLILYLHKKRFINHFLGQKESCSRRLFAQGAESAVVSARIILLLGIIHFVIISLCLLGGQPSRGSVCSKVLYHCLPPAVFVLCMVFNQIGIRYFNRLMAHTEYVPIVDTKGNVIGKSLAIEAVNYKNTYMNPVIRMAVTAHGMLFLCHRPPNCVLDKGKTDHPMECYLHFGETLTQGAERVIKNTFPEAKEELKPSFNILYHFENGQTNRLIYLFILDVANDEILCDPRFKGGKLWRFQQIEQNLEKHFFSECFEHEYEHLKTVIGIREKYKES